jgi:hypothetical protein
MGTIRALRPGPVGDDPPPWPRPGEAYRRSSLLAQLLVAAGLLGALAFYNAVVVVTALWLAGMLR